MATFSMWWRGVRKNPNVRSVTWVCGTERILVDEVVATIRKMLQPSPWDYVPLSAAEDSEREIWSQALVCSQTPDIARLIVIRHADRLKHPERVQAFTKKATAPAKTHVVLVSDAEFAPRLPPTDEQKFRSAKGDIVPWLTGSNVHVIECRPFTADTAKVAVEWVRTKTGMREAVAGYLLNRADGNMRLVRDVCMKLSVFDGEATISAVNELLSEQPRATFVDALIAMDKKGALAALERMMPDDYSPTLGMLDAQVDLAGMVHDMTLEHATPYEISRKAGNKSFLIKDLIPVARHYDPKRRATMRRTLALADEALRLGARVGVMEAVTALW